MKPRSKQLLKENLRSTRQGFAEISAALGRQQQQLARLDGEINGLKSELDRVSRVFHGNGRQPLETRLTLLETKVAEHRKWLFAAVGAVLVQILAALVSGGLWLLSKVSLL